MKVEIPVIVEVEPDQFKVVGERKIGADYREHLETLIDAGLRAVLGLQSLITGKLLIELDFHANTPVNLRNGLEDIPEVPTIPSAAERLLQTLQKLDLEGMQKDLQDTLAGIDALVNDPDLKAGIHEVRGLLADTRGPVNNVDGRIGSLSGEIDANLSDTRRLLNNVDRQVTPTADNLNRNL